MSELSPKGRERLKMALEMARHQQLHAVEILKEINIPKDSENYSVLLIAAMQVIATNNLALMN